ncbi:MAG: ATP-dependent protease ATPase subunit HslU [Eubacteriales bacterium]|nr:ATP-dependent protease ATPase subunit HslU [Eubacteriales bacterium]
MMELSPVEIVNELNKYIIGQDGAKRAVAVALRNRYRRSRLSEEMKAEVTPKNIIMVGPTGVGKTEIARRLAKLVRAPFVKVEATKFTEVGYVGRDVDSMVRDLVEAAIRLVKEKKTEAVKEEATARANERLAKALAPSKRIKKSRGPIEMLMGAPAPEEELEPDEELKIKRSAILDQLKRGALENTLVEVEIEESQSNKELMPGSGVELNLNDIMGGMLPKKTKKRSLPVREARRILEQEEAMNLIDMDEVTTEALALAENHGIIFIDEIDKIAGRSASQGPDVSREGVQRDILPLVEGSTVTTKYGPVKTDYVLFIAAGAFHVSKISDLIPELQGRFPIKVELGSLSEQDFLLILSQPENALIKQYAAMLEVDHIHLNFEDSALEAIAHYAYVANETKENLGARRLHTIMESLLEDISFNASGNHPMIDVNVDSRYVAEHLKDVVVEEDLTKFII